MLAKCDENGRECMDCGEYKTYDNYHKHRSCKHGFNTVCKDCRKPKSQAHYKTTSKEYRIWSRAKSRSRERCIPFNIGVSDIQIPEFCPVFGMELKYGDMDWTPSIDKIDPHLGYVKGNIQIISNRANRMKSDGTPEEFERLAKFMRSRA